jgi:hypothetical protein
MNNLITESGPSEAAALDPNRHRRKCSVCNHPERGAIEEEFLHWCSPRAIGVHYDIHRKAIYRHAHAMGLFAQRRGNIRSVLEHLIEQAEHAKVTGETIINAVRALTCLQDDGRWVEPPRRVIYSIEHLPAEAGSAHTPPAYPRVLRDSAGHFMGGPPASSDDSSQSGEFLIVPGTIRNGANSMETKEATQV